MHINKNYSIQIISTLLITANILCSCSALRHIDKDKTIVIPFILENDRIVVHATVNGTEGKYFFDTGAVPIVTTAPLDNLPLIEGGFFSYPAYHIKNGIIINNQLIESDPFICNPVPGVSRGEIIQLILQNESFDGVLGYGAFQGYWCELSFSESKIVLHRTKPKRPFKPCQVYTESPAHFFIPVQIDDNSFKFVLDTGSQTGFLFHHTFVKNFLDRDYYEVITTDGKLFVMKTNTIKTLDDNFVDKYIRTSPVNPLVDIGIMGVEYLQNYDFLLNYTHSHDDGQAEIYYQPRSSEIDRKTRSFANIEDDTRGKFGITLIYTEQGAYIEGVNKPGIAHDEYGIVPGMTITHINGISIITLRNEEIIKAFGDLADTGYGELTVLDTANQERIIRKNKEVQHE